MIRAALTGGIATGKSHCLAGFARLGAATIDADVLAREALAPATPGLSRVVERFGRAILAANGTLDRAALARIVFADGAARTDLEAIVHPEVYRRMSAWAASLPASTRVAVADVPLLYETGHQHEFDRVIVCACEPELQVRRVMARDGLSEAEARARLDAQWPIADKAARADILIRTDGTIAETDRQVREVYETLKAEAEKGG